MARLSSRFLFRFISNFSRNYAALWVTIVVRPSIRRSVGRSLSAKKFCDTTISTLGAGGNATRVANVLYTVLVYSLLSTMIQYLIYRVTMILHSHFIQWYRLSTHVADDLNFAFIHETSLECDSNDIPIH